VRGDWQAAHGRSCPWGRPLMGHFSLRIGGSCACGKSASRADRAEARPRALQRAVGQQPLRVVTNAFYLAILPFCLNLAPRPLWRHALDAIAVLMVFDFLYYLTHRFLFHGKALRKVHALHHQARTPTFVDGLYVHPLETFIGLVLFLGSMPLIAALTGGPLSAFSMAVATLIFTQLNTINHCYVNLPELPLRTSPGSRRSTQPITST
jgi:hypothetical protein